MPIGERNFRLIVGLGNPGTKYSGNRHNIGFMVLDKLASGNKWIVNKEKTLVCETQVGSVRAMLYVALGSFPDAELMEDEANKLEQKFNGGYNKEYYIELADYLNANHHKDSTAWYVVGSILNFEFEKVYPVVYMLMRGKDEAGMMNYILLIPS